MSSSTPSGSRSRSTSPLSATDDTALSPASDKAGPETVAAEALLKTDGASSHDESKTSTPAPTTTSATAHDWQAIFSPAHNAYYFYNARTNETTWQNPLQPTASTSQSSTSSSATASASPELQASSSTSPGPAASAAVAQMYAMQAAAAAQGIDPSLAFLDPTLAQGSGSGPTPFEFTAKFNSRTGAFTKADARDPGHLSEFERMKRMSEVYFDMAEWERQVALQKEEEEREGKKRKKPTKKDLDRWKEQKRLKKIAKTAWLRT